MKIETKRAYQNPAESDGARFLVDRLWPRGVKKESFQITGWLKDAAPSAALRKWFGHDPKKWADFQRRYTRELDANPSAWQRLVDAARNGKVTLLYSAHDTHRNNAVALKKYLNAKLKGE